MRLKNISNLFIGYLSTLTLCAVIALSAGCRTPKSIEIDHRFSYNVARVPTWFPGEKYVPNPAEQELLERRGRPDYIRFWWLVDGTFISSADLSGKVASIMDEMAGTKRTWVYLQDNKEIEFKEDGSGYLEHPVVEQLALICKYGDPTERDPVKTSPSGAKLETWQWRDYGIRINFVDGKEIKRETFHGTGRGTIIKP